MDEKKIIGILNEGDETTIKGCEFHNCDVGIHNKGKRMTASKNKFFKRAEGVGFWKKDLLFPLLVTILGGTILSVIQYFIKN